MRPPWFAEPHELYRRCAIPPAFLSYDDRSVHTLHSIASAPLAVYYSYFWLSIHAFPTSLEARTSSRIPDYYLSDESRIQRRKQDVQE